MDLKIPKTFNKFLLINVNAASLGKHTYIHTYWLFNKIVITLRPLENIVLWTTWSGVRSNKNLRLHEYTYIQYVSKAYWALNLFVTLDLCMTPLRYEYKNERKKIKETLVFYLLSCLFNLINFFFHFFFFFFFFVFLFYFNCHQTRTHPKKFFLVDLKI